jgi:hypothetical protein
MLRRWAMPLELRSELGAEALIAAWTFACWLS